MMVCVHAAVGAGLGALARRPLPAALLGVVSHLVCDLVPHKDYDFKVEAPLALLMFAFIARRHGFASPQFWGAAFAVLPDGENALALHGVIPKNKTFFPSHNEAAPWFLGHGRKLESPLSQVILAAAALWLAGRKTKKE